MALQSTPLEYDPNALPESTQVYRYDALNTTDHDHPNLPELDHNSTPYYKEDNVATVLPAEKSPKVTFFSSRRTICGLRRRIAIGILVVIILIVAIVGGVVGGVLSRRNSSANPESSGTSSPSSNPNSTPTSTSSVAATPTPMRGISTAQDKSSIFNIWQKANGEIWHHPYYFGGLGWTESSKVELTLTPINNTALSAAAWEWDDYFEIRIYYTAQSEKMLAEAGYRCYKNGTLCTEPVNNPTPQSVALSAGVGIYSISTELNYLRQYMIDADGYIAQVEYDPYSGWHAANRINDELKAHRASPIAAGMVGGEIWLFWFDDFKNLKTTTSVYKSSTWTEPKTINTTIPAELPRSLGIAISDTPLAVQLFFFDDTKLQHIWYINKKWTTEDTNPPEASISNGPLGVTGWDDTSVRMFYPVEGKIQELVWENLNRKWSIGDMQADIYD